MRFEEFQQFRILLGGEPGNPQIVTCGVDSSVRPRGVYQRQTEKSQRASKLNSRLSDQIFFPDYQKTRPRQSPKEPGYGLIGFQPVLRQAVQLTARKTAYRVDVRCSTNHSCTDSAEIAVRFVPDVPPAPVGNTLRCAREGLDIRFTWSENGSYAYNVRRHGAKTFDRPTSEIVGTVRGGELLAPDEVPASPPTAFYRVFGASCSGREE